MNQDARLIVLGAAGRVISRARFQTDAANSFALQGTGRPATGRCGIFFKPTTKQEEPMWWFTTDPIFVSVVQKPNRPGILCVRSRWERDLGLFRDRLAAEHSPPLTPEQARDTYPIQVGGGTDYEVRLWAPHDMVAAVAHTYVMELDYNNVKGRVGQNDPPRARVLSRIWSIVANAARPQNTF